MNRVLSIPEWHRMGKDGTSIPIRIPLMGWSMYPLIRYNRDYVTIIPLVDPPQIGDIVLYYDCHKDAYVMHRVWSITGEMVLTWGDNCQQADGWMPIESLLGKAVKIERGKKVITPNHTRGLRWAKFWHHAGKILRLYNTIKEELTRNNKQSKT